MSAALVLPQLRHSLAKQLVAVVAVVAMSLGAIAVFAPAASAEAAPTAQTSSNPIAWPYDPDDPFNWDSSMDLSQWWTNGTLILYGLTDVAGAYLKDIADGRIFRGYKGLPIGPDMLKYSMGGLIMIGFAVVSIIVELANQKPSFEELLAERVEEVAKRTALLEGGLNYLDAALDNVLERVEMLSHRATHNMALTHTGNIDYYYDTLMRIAGMGDDAPTGLALDMYVDDAIHPTTVAQDWTALRGELWPTAGEGLITAFAKVLGQPGLSGSNEGDHAVLIVGDDRAAYRELFDYTAFWGQYLHQAVQVMSEAYSHLITHEDTSDTRAQTLLDEMENMLAVHNADLRNLWEPLGHPIANDTVTLAGDLAVAREMSVPPAGDAADMLTWNSTMNADMFNRLLEAAAYGEGATSQERLASLGIEVPAIVKLSDPSGRRQIAINHGTWTSGYGSMKNNDNPTWDCDYYGFTRPLQVERTMQKKHWLFGWGIPAQHASNSDVYYTDGVHCVPKLHIDGESGSSTGDYRLDLRSGNDPVRVQGWQNLPAVDLANDPKAMKNGVDMYSLPTTTFSLTGPATLEVYVDRQLVTRARGESALYNAGPVDEVTLTLDRKMVPEKGVGIVLDESSLDGQLARFSGLYNGIDTVTIDDLKPGGHYQIFSTLDDRLAGSRTATIGATGPGRVVATVDGKIVASAIAGEPMSFPIPDEIEDVVLTTDTKEGAQKGLVLTAIGEDDVTWSLGSNGGTNTVPLSGDLNVTGSFGAQQASTVDIAASGWGAAQVRHGEHVVATIDASSPQQVQVPTSSLLVTDDPAGVG
ncbi:MAG: hypothetical protein AAFY28_05330, partial [Actinomycetota bacterium]